MRLINWLLTLLKKILAFIRARYYPGEVVKKGIEFPTVLTSVEFEEKSSK